MCLEIFYICICDKILYYIGFLFQLRNPGDFKFATVKDSPVEAYFKTQLEYDTMLRTMQKYVYTTPEEALKVRTSTHQIATLSMKFTKLVVQRT